ncbi:uncharacterized protein LY89DRAFT_681683 [Mollisia scopiformis]|uniref:Uncharacterized protein n=1 Tax=Mollisia scopiformis TaxID=149040 RepID=A0A194XLQ0_MOLSC|nr:uncharacterized protein LY89DRAFT_681683 [Mollisia scopiformis]KUJ21061.1 hypothetical protein LY89DRAFT_681683 [Mollisia scopiformis]
MPKSFATEAKKPQRSPATTKTSAHKSKNGSPSKVQTAKTEVVQFTDLNGAQRLETVELETLNKIHTKHLDVPREWPTWPPSGTLPYTHHAMSAYETSWTMGLGPMDRWEQETSLQGPWNDIAAVQDENVNGIVSGGILMADEEDVTRAGTWWPKGKDDV